MDKYAVDLDQVLNDFEYSELTDQHNNVSRNTSTTLAQNTVTKHSINNVFHSLNEYLNTSIDVNTANQIDNNLLIETKGTCIVEGANNSSQDEETSINQSNPKTGTLPLETIEGDAKVEDITERSAGKSDVTAIGGNEEAQETEEHGDNATFTAAEEVEEEKTELYINGECGEHVSRETERPVIEEVDFKEDLTLTVKDNVDESDHFEDATEKIGDTERQIGFEDDVELDENEALKLLEELEGEDLESGGGSVEPQITAEALGSVQYADTSSDVCQTVDNQCDASEITSLPSLDPKTSPAEDAAPNEETPSPGETVTELVNVANTPTPPDPETKDSTPLVLQEASAEVVATDEPTQEPATGEEKNAGIVLSEGHVDDVTEAGPEEERDVEEESSVDSVSRPRNLPLNGDGDPPKRKIDLIGDPGSTPYNNVYINKEIPKTKEGGYDSDTDYSTSSSPTASDASSTASTVSIDDVQDVKDARAANPASGAAPNPADPTPSEPPVDSAREEPSGEAAEAISTERRGVSEEASPVGPGSSAGATRTGDGSNSEGVGEASTSQAENPEAVAASAANPDKQWLGREAPLWVPDADATSCLHCDMRFTVLKRRHHCRACGLVLCSKCCHLRFRLEYLDAEARVCNRCHDILNRDASSTSSGSDVSPDAGNSPSYRPNPNNPLEYCSTVSPLQQAAGADPNPPAVMVPVGVLKRKGSNKAKSNKSVMFCDGIRPGSDLTNLDNDFDYNNTKTKKPEKTAATPGKPKVNVPATDPDTNTFIPSNENFLPPTVVVSKTDISYSNCSNGPAVVDVLKNKQLTFALQGNLYVHVRIINMSCCINKVAWCFSTEGLINVGQDEIVILLEYIDEESFVPKDVFYHINNVHSDAVKGTAVKEMGLSLHNASNFLDSKNHAGFLYIRPTFQCLENVIRPKEPYLVGILIHRWETPWAKLFPLRLVLRLGAEYRYYPSPLISTRHRESVFVEIGHTIVNLLADFRNFSYTLPQIRGLTVHMEDKNTIVTIPANRYDQVMKSISNSSDHILAFAGNFSQLADSHLVCIQDTQGNENCYSTHAINIHNKPRKVTGASFIVFNGALKSTSGLTAKSNIVEDGLMIQVLPEHMQLIRDSLRAMKDHSIACGCVNAVSDETVRIVWGENDVNFNMGVLSAIDNTPLSGVPSIRVHNAKNHVCANGSRIIRWTEVFIVQNGEDNPKNQDSIDVSRLSEGIAKATCDALVKYLDLLIANGCQKIGIRTTLHVDNVSYLAGSNGTKLAPIYMKSLDNELIPVLHRITTNNLGEHSIVLELVFRILNL